MSLLNHFNTLLKLNQVLIMPELNLQHIDQISRDISREEISFSHLLEDLIDHVCCDVEYEMQSGLDFHEAYIKVKKKMGSGRLKEIQQETLYSVDTNYRNMKNLVKISGVAGTIMFGFAALFKIQHWPGAGQMMSLGALFLAFIFLPSALSVLWKETHNRKRLFLFISAFFAGMLFILGTLFKIQHWPMAGALLTLAALSGILFFIPALALSRLSDQENKAKRPVYILGAAGAVLFVAGLLFKIQHWPLATVFILCGIFLLCFLSMPIFTWLTWKEASHISPKFIFMVIGFLLIIVPGAMLTLSLQQSYQDSYFPNNDQQKALYDYLFRSNNSLISSYKDSSSYHDMESLHLKTAEILTTLSNIEKRMVQESEGQPGKPAVSARQISQTETGQKINYRELSKPFDPGPVKTYLTPGSSTRNELNSSMEDYFKFLAGVIRAEDMQKYKKMLDTETFLPALNPADGKISLMTGLHTLESMKNGLLTVESCVLNTIAFHGN
jgi:drug/metabolite transporter (DMT)-like permease